MHPSTTLLDSARQALRGGRHAQAAALYQACIDQGLPVEAEFAGMFYAGGEFERAERILGRALGRRADDDGTLRFLRGLSRIGAGRARGGLEDFDASLRANPGQLPVLFNRALALFLLERVDEAVPAMRKVCELSPGSVDAWANLGILYMRRGEWADAIDALECANRLAPGQAPLLRSLGNALASAGRRNEALALLARAEALAPDDPSTLVDHALLLFNAGFVDEARTRFERARARDPRDQTALAGLYLVAVETGDAATLRQLMDFGALIGLGGHERTDPVDTAALRAAVLTHPELVWDPSGRSTMHGQQTAKLDLDRGSAFAGFGAMVQRFVARRLHELKLDPALREHPWCATAPHRWRLQAWATVLHAGGHQTPHIHPAGWMSGVFYLDAGESTADGGCLVFGHPQADVALSRPPVEHVHVPSTGQLIAFPSYFFHHTRPYAGRAPRISLAFDVLPD